MGLSNAAISLDAGAALSADLGEDDCDVSLVAALGGAEASSPGKYSALSVPDDLV